MVQLIKPQQVQISTKDGELLVHIMLDINLNLGDVRLGAAQRQDGEEPAKEEEKVEWQVPEFSSAKVKFGKEQKV